MVYFTAIEPTEHYTEEHEREVPWHKVVEIILTTQRIQEKKQTNLKLTRMVIIYYLK